MKVGQGSRDAQGRGQLGHAFDAHDGAGREFSGDLIIGTQAEVRPAGDDGFVGGLERLAIGINDEARGRVGFEQSEDLLRQPLVGGIVQTIGLLVGDLTVRIDSIRAQVQEGRAAGPVSVGIGADVIADTQLGHAEDIAQASENLCRKIRRPDIIDGIDDALDGRWRIRIICGGRHDRSREMWRQERITEEISVGNIVGKGNHAA